MVLAGRVQTEIRGIKSESFKAGSRVKKLFLTKTVPLVNPLLWDPPVHATFTTYYDFIPIFGLVRKFLFRNIN